MSPTVGPSSAPVSPTSAPVSPTVAPLAPTAEPAAVPTSGSPAPPTPAQPIVPPTTPPTSVPAAPTAMPSNGTVAQTAEPSASPTIAATMPVAAPTAAPTPPTVTYQVVIVMEDATDFDIDAFLQPFANLSNVSISQVEVVELEFTVTSVYEFPAGVLLTTEQIIQAVAAQANVPTSSVTAVITTVEAAARRLGVRGRRLSAMSVETKISTPDPSVAQAALESSTNVITLSSALSEVAGRTIQAPTVTATPALAVHVEAAVESAGLELPALPEASELATEFGNAIGKEITLEIGVVDEDATPAPTATPTIAPTTSPTIAPTAVPTTVPTAQPTARPTTRFTMPPTSLTGLTLPPTTEDDGDNWVDDIDSKAPPTRTLTAVVTSVLLSCLGMTAASA